MSKLNRVAGFAALQTFANSRVELIKALQKAGYSTVELARPLVIEFVAERTGCPLNTMKNGKVCLDSSFARYNTAKQAVRDLMLMIEGTSRSEQQLKAINDAKKKQHSITPTPKELACAMQLVIACKGDPVRIAAAIAKAKLAAKG